MGIDVTTTFNLDAAAVVALNDPAGIIGQGTRRAAETTAERARAAVDSRGLVDTGRMRGSIDIEIEASARGVIGRVGSTVDYAIYHPVFLTDALAQLTVNDFEGAS